MAADYSITSTADVFSTTAPGEVRLFNTAGTFASRLRASAAAITPYTLTLPPVAGSTGWFTQLTQTPQTLGWVPNAIISNTSCPYNGRYYLDSTTRCFTTSAVNVSADHIIYVGSTIMNGPPSAMFALLGASDLATTMVVTVQDITNSLTVASLTVSSATFTAINVPNSVNMGAISNISTTECIWQVLIRRSAGTGFVFFYGFQIIG
jgi:hypothetical protein